MSTERSVLIGFTDYTGVPFEDILDHIRDWQRVAAHLITVVAALGERVSRLPQSFESQRGLAHLGYMADLFRRLDYDCARLVRELPTGVEERHLQIIASLTHKVEQADRLCVQFNKDLLLRSEESEPAASLGEVYRQTRDGVLYFVDLANTIPRLATLVGATPPAPGLAGSTQATWRRLESWLRREGEKRGRVWSVLGIAVGLVLAAVALL